MKTLTFVFVLALNANALFAFNNFLGKSYPDEDIAETLLNSNNQFDLIMRLLLYESSSTPFVDSPIDGMVLVYSPDYSNCANTEDGTKLFNFGENLFMVTDGKSLSFQFRETPETNLNEIEDIHLFGLTDTQYKFGIEFLNVNGIANFSNGVFIWDKYLDTYTSVSDGDTITFDIDYAIPASFDQTRFAYVFSNSPVKNDNSFNAINLDVNSSASGNDFTLDNATAQINEPDLNFSDGVNNSVWFKFEAPASGSVSISTDVDGGTLLDSEVAAYIPGTCNSNLSDFILIGYDDNSGLYNPYSSILNLSGLSPGDTYYVQVDSSNGASAGTFGIEVRELFLYNHLSGFSPSNPNGLNAPGSVLFIESGTANITSNTNLYLVFVSSNAVLNLDNCTLNANIYFKSDSFGSGQIDDATGSSVNGEVLVERHLASSSRAFRFLASPVSTVSSIRENWQEDANTSNLNPIPQYGTHITGAIGTVGNINANGLDETNTGNPSLFTFNNAFSGDQDLAWQPILNTNSNTLNSQTPYLLFVRGDRSIDLSNNSALPTPSTLRSKGNLFLGTDNSQVLNQVQDKFSFIANPYQATVDINNVNTMNLNTQFIWYWDPNLNNSAGGYVTVSLPTGTNNTASQVNQFLQPGQSLFMQTDITNSSLPASITFEENDKNLTATPTNIFSETGTSLKILLYRTDALNLGLRETDGLLINFNDTSNSEIDQSDSQKMFNYGENFARFENNKAISIENRAHPLQEEILDLFINNFTETEYSFKVYSQHSGQPFPIYLIDNYTGNSIDISTGETHIDFSIDHNIPETTASDRFQLWLENTALSVDEGILHNEFILYPNPTSDGLFGISTPWEGGLAKIEIINLLGQSVFLKNIAVENNTIHIDAKNLAAGIYLLKLSQHKNTQSFKLIVE